MAAYIAQNYRMINKDLLKEISALLNRSESALVRKINRLRAVHTGKAPYATELDKGAAITMKELPEELGKDIFFESLRELQANTGKINRLLSNSKKVNKLRGI